MKFGLMYEFQLPRPWSEDSEANLIRDALVEVELADKLGYDTVWENEHHFIEEYSFSSAPEVFLAACAARTEKIRLGHAVVLSPPGFNQPARVAERLATLDLVSGGRVEWGTGESASRMELEGYGVDPARKKAMWAEATEQTANMMAMTPYPGFDGEFFSMPCRNVVPKPMQKPHPPIWVACSKRETIRQAARAGIGALAFAFVDPEEAGEWAKEYYSIIKSDECVPIGHTVNANIAMATGFACHEDEAEAHARGSEGFQYFGYVLGHYYVFGQHQPGVTNIWERFQQARSSLPDLAHGNGIGTPDQLIDRLKRYQEAGVDEMIFIQQSGRTKHEHIIEAITLFADKVMPVMKAGAAEREARKKAELEPYIAAALARKSFMKPLRPEEVPIFPAYGRSIVEGGGDKPVYSGPTDDKPHPANSAGFSLVAHDPLEKSANASE